MSALPPKADIRWCARHVRFVPIADVARYGSRPRAAAAYQSVAPWKELLILDTETVNSPIAAWHDPEEIRGYDKMSWSPVLRHGGCHE